MLAVITNTDENTFHVMFHYVIVVRCLIINIYKYKINTYDGALYWKSSVVAFIIDHRSESKL